MQWGLEFHHVTKWNHSPAGKKCFLYIYIYKKYIYMYIYIHMYNMYIYNIYVCTFIKTLFKTQEKKSVYLSASVIHQLHRPSSFILDPHKYTPFHIAGGELLKGFIPTHQDNLQKCAKTLLLFFGFFFANTGASLHRGTFMINTQHEHNAKKTSLFCLNVISKSAAVGRRVTRCDDVVSSETAVWIWWAKQYASVTLWFYPSSFYTSSW